MQKIKVFRKSVVIETFDEDVTPEKLIGQLEDIRKEWGADADIRLVLGSFDVELVACLYTPETDEEFEVRMYQTEVASAFGSL